MTGIGPFGLAVLGLAIVGGFAMLSSRAAEGSEKARWAAALSATALCIPAAFGALLALLLAAMRCDESCDENLTPEVRSGDWWHSLDAWQWYGQLGVELIGTLAIFVALTQTVRRRHWSAAAWVAGAAVCFAAWAALLAPLGDRLGI